MLIPLAIVFWKGSSADRRRDRTDKQQLPVEELL